jgi:fidgetin-like protein 1
MKKSPQELDDAARRRFVKKLFIPLPDVEGRRQIVINLMNKQSSQLNEDEVEEISNLTEGYSGADMTNLCREAALGPIRSLDMNSVLTISEEDVNLTYKYFKNFKI